MSIYEKLVQLQNEIKAPKGQYNSFGKYNYRSCEDICTALKPLCEKHKVAVTIADQITEIGNRFYITAIVTLTDCENPSDKIIGTAFAREDEVKKGMDGSQITGSASSYARKYALAGLLLLDDTVDSDGLQPDDSNKQSKASKTKKYTCCDCGKEFEAGKTKDGAEFTAEQAYNTAKKFSSDSKARCKECREKFKQGASE